MTFIFLLFLVQALLNISVAWIEIANKSNVMQINNANNIQRYRRVVYGFELVLTFTLIILGSINIVWAIPLILGVVVVCIIIPSYIYGTFKILQVIKFLHKTALSTVQFDPNSGSLSSSDNTKAKKFEEQMRAIQYTSIVLVLLSVIVSASLGYVVLVDGTNHAGNSPEFAVGYIVYRIGAFFTASLGYLVIDYYLQPKLMGRVRKRKCKTWSNDGVWYI